MEGVTKAERLIRVISKEVAEGRLAAVNELKDTIIETSMRAEALTKKIEELTKIGVPEAAGKKGPSVLAGLDLEEAGDRVETFLDKLKQIPDIMARIPPAIGLEELDRQFEELLDRGIVKFNELDKVLIRVTADVTGAVQDTIGNTFMAIGDFIENVVAGVSGAGKKLAATVLNVFGMMAQQIGAMVIVTSKAIAALKTLNVVAGIGLGLSLIALGGALKGIASRLSAQATAAPAAGGGGGTSGMGYYRQPAVGASRSPAPETRFFFITDGGRPREGSRHEAESYLERTLQGSTKRTFKRMVRTDELAFS